MGCSNLSDAIMLFAPSALILLRIRILINRRSSASRDFSVSYMPTEALTTSRTESGENTKASPMGNASIVLNNSSNEPSPAFWSFAAPAIWFFSASKA